MTLRQMLQFRQVLRRTGCLAAALAAAGLGRRKGGGSRGPARRGAHSGAAGTAADFDLEQAVAALESEAVRRALSGVSLPVFHQGRQCGSTTRHSDQLLVFLLKTLKPERYGPGREKDEADAGPFVLDIDLSAADCAPGEEAEAAGAG
jgi:hypothetical protein